MKRYERYIDADMTHPWSTKYRIPVIDIPNPAHSYALALTSNDDIDAVVNDTLVSEDEVYALSCYLGYMLYASCSARELTLMRKDTFDTDPYFNTMVFFKDSSGSWYYRQASWSLWMGFESSTAYDSLLELLDDIEEANADADAQITWNKWKRECRLT